MNLVVVLAQRRGFGDGHLASGLGGVGGQLLADKPAARFVGDPRGRSDVTEYDLRGADDASFDTDARGGAHLRLIETFELQNLIGCTANVFRGGEP